MHDREGHFAYTLGGILAICAWSSYWPVARLVTHAYGAFRAGAFQYGFGGILGCIYLSFKKVRDTKEETKVSVGCLRNKCTAQFLNPIKYYAFAMCPYILYPLVLGFAFRLADKSEQVLLLTICNYLWPEILACMNVAFEHTPIRWCFPVGVSLAVVGVVVAAIPEDTSAIALAKALADEMPFVTLGITAAALFASFSACSKAYLHADGNTSVPVANVVCGGLLAVVSTGLDEDFEPDLEATIGLLYCSVACTFVGKFWWELALRKGHARTVSSFAFLAPVLSMTFSSSFFGVKVRSGFYCGACLVCGGAVLVRFGVVERRLDGAVRLKEASPPHPSMEVEMSKKHDGVATGSRTPSHSPPIRRTIQVKAYDTVHPMSPVSTWQNPWDREDVFDEWDQAITRRFG